MEYKIQDVATIVFIFAVAILTFVVVLGIWDIFDKDVIYKSVATIGIIGFAALVAIIAGRFLEKGSNTNLS
jgi:uncharacterized membrane protein